MIAQRTMIIENRIKDVGAMVREAVRLLLSQSSTQRWVCEVCGMIHSEAAPVECDSCGSPELVQHLDSSREMNSHW